MDIDFEESHYPEVFQLFPLLEDSICSVIATSH